MSNGYLKIGSSSIICGKNHYNKFIAPQKSKLLKITKITESHNEFKYLDEVRTINNYKKYYTIPDETCFLLQPSDEFYNYIETLVLIRNINIFGNTLNCYLIDYAGDKDLHNTIVDLNEKTPFLYWKSYSQILHFCKKILKAINFLHQKKICHLDIKAENIIVNTTFKTYKIIDFGFASKEPFDDYIENIRGTPCYFPKQFDIEDIKPWFPKIEANDIEGEIPMRSNRDLVYKIDTYCFGRVMYLLKYIFNENTSYWCFSHKNEENKLNKIIEDLLENDVYTRLKINEILLKYY